MLLLSILFVFLFVFNFYFVLIFELFNLLLILFIYLIYLFIIIIFFLLHNFLGTLDLFPSLQLTKILDPRLCYMPQFLVHLRRRLKYTIVITRCPSYLTFHILDFSSETTERNSTKHDRKQDLIVLYQACVFSGLIRKTRWLPWPIRQKVGILYSGARFVALWAPSFILDLFIMFHIVHREIAFIM